MAEFIKNSPFRFWCQKVLPLVYDDSLSYYELLCKVVCKLNELAENQNNLSDEIKQVAQDLNDFKNQIPGMIEAKVEEWLNNYITTHGLVNSVNGMKGDVVLKKLTATTEGGLSISGENGYNGSEEKTIEIAAGGVTADKIANGAVATDKIADGAVTAQKIADGTVTGDKLAAGVVPEKLPNPHKLTFSGGATGEYDGSVDVNIVIPSGGGGGGGNAPLTFTGAVDATYDGTEAVTVNIPHGGSGGGAVDSVNGMTGAVVLKKLTANEGLSMSGGDGYNGSAEQTVGIAPGGVTNDKIADGAVNTGKMENSSVTNEKLANGCVTTEKMANSSVTNEKLANGSVTAEKMADGVIPTALPTPNALTAGDGLTITDGSFNGSKAAILDFESAVQITATGNKISATIYVQENQFLALAPCYIKITSTVALKQSETVTATATRQMDWQNRMGIFSVYGDSITNAGIVKYIYNAKTHEHTIRFFTTGVTFTGEKLTASGILGISD